MSDYGISRRLKRVRSTSNGNYELDAELQASIRSQNNGSKRSRLASGAGRSFSSSFAMPPARVSKLAKQDEAAASPAQLSHDARTPDASAMTMAEGATRVPHGENAGSIRSLWHSMSGFFVKDRMPPVSVRETVDTYEALHHSRQRPNSPNSPRDSGIYLDSRPSSRLKQDNTDGVGRDVDFIPMLEPPRFAAVQTSESPLKRLQAASISGLRKVKSLALRPQPSREDMQKEALMKKMTSLQSQLDECKHEFTRLFATSSVVQAFPSPDPMPQLSLPVSPKSDRGTQTLVNFHAAAQRESDSPSLVAGDKIHASIEEDSNIAVPRRSTPENWPLPAQPDLLTEPTMSNSGPALRRVPNLHSLRTPEMQELSEPEPDPEPTKLEVHSTTVEQAMADHAETEFARRSLSTIPSSGDEKSSPAATPAKYESKENERPSSGRSNRNSRIPRQTPRKPAAVTMNALIDDDALQLLPKIHAIKGAKEATSKIESPRAIRARGRVQKSSSSGSPKRKDSIGKKIVGGRHLGHYDDQGEWVWGPEAF